MTNGGIALDHSELATALVSTNGMNWTPSSFYSLPTSAGQRQFFVRAVNDNWTCIERMRALDEAKQRWAMDYHRTAADTPMDSDLFGPTRYLRSKPTCPANGTYTLNPVDTKPTCTESSIGHTL